MRVIGLRRCHTLEEATDLPHIRILLEAQLISLLQLEVLLI